MRPSDPARVGISHVLVIPELERVAGIRITDGIPASNKEGRCTSGQPATAVGAGNFQNVNSEITQTNIRFMYGAEHLPRVSGVGIDHHGGRYSIGASQPDTL